MIEIVPPYRTSYRYFNRAKQYEFQQYTLIQSNITLFPQF